MTHDACGRDRRRRSRAHAPLRGAGRVCFCFALRARGSRPTGDMGRAERAVHLGHLVVVDDLWARRLASPERLGANDAVPERRASGGCHLATSTFRSTLGGLTVASWLTLSAGATSGARRRARVSGWSSESGPGSVRLPYFGGVQRLLRRIRSDHPRSCRSRAGRGAAPRGPDRRRAGGRRGRRGLGGRPQAQRSEPTPGGPTVATPVDLRILTSSPSRRSGNPCASADGWRTLRRCALPGYSSKVVTTALNSRRTASCGVPAGRIAKVRWASRGSASRVGTWSRSRMTTCEYGL